MHWDLLVLSARHPALTVAMVTSVRAYAPRARQEFAQKLMALVFVRYDGSCIQHVLNDIQNVRGVFKNTRTDAAIPSVFD